LCFLKKQKKSVPQQEWGGKTGVPVGGVVCFGVVVGVGVFQKKHWKGLKKRKKKMVFFGVPHGGEIENIFHETHC